MAMSDDIISPGAPLTTPPQPRRQVTKRGLTRALITILSPLLLLALLAGVKTTATDYVAYSPGPLLSATATVNGAATPLQNNYHFTTIIARSVTYWDLIKLNLTKHPTTTLIHLNLDPTALATNATAMAQSRLTAAMVAKKILGAPYYIQVIAPSSPAAGRNVLVGDELIAINGTPALLDTQLPTTTHPGQKLSLTLTRGASKEFIVDLTTPASAAPTPMGITLSPTNKITANLKLQVLGASGPSGGLAMTLQAIDTLLAKSPGGVLDAANKKIIATGTISPNGAVGAVGGVDQKVRSAKGAAVFMIPSGEVKQAKANAPANLTIQPITSIDQAISWLCKNTAKPNNPLCTTLAVLSTPAL